VRILIPPRSRDPNSAAASGGTASDGANFALCQQKDAQQKPQLSQQPENKLGPHEPGQLDSQTQPHQQQLIQNQPQQQQLNQSLQQHKPQQQPEITKDMPKEQS